MKSKNRGGRLLLLCMVLACLFLVFIFLKYQKGLGGQDIKSSESYTLGMVLSNISNPFFESLAAEAQKEADRQGVTLILLDSKDLAETEYANVTSLVEAQVDCIIVNPTDSDTVYQAIQYANDKNIPLVTVDRASNGGIVVCHIESDNLAGGEMIATYLLEQTQNKGSYA